MRHEAKHRGRLGAGDEDTRSDVESVANRITWWQAAEIIGIIAGRCGGGQRRYEEHGYAGLRDRRRGRESEKRVPLEQVEEVLRLYQDQQAFIPFTSLRGASAKRWSTGET